MKLASESPSKKKPYESPKLLIYGNLTQMTQSRGLTGRPDNGKNPRARRTG
jgi:hypothetical protein